MPSGFGKSVARERYLFSHTRREQTRIFDAPNGDGLVPLTRAPAPRYLGGRSRRQSEHSAGPPASGPSDVPILSHPAVVGCARFDCPPGRTHFLTSPVPAILSAPRRAHGRESALLSDEVLRPAGEQRAPPNRVCGSGRADCPCTLYAVISASYPFSHTPAFLRPSLVPIFSHLRTHFLTPSYLFSHTCVPIFSHPRTYSLTPTIR
jgi:hypothetical protein